MKLPRCPLCNVTADDSAWERLPLIAEIHADDVRHLVERWPWDDDIVLVVRACPCGGSLVRRERRALPSARQRAS